MSVKVPPWKALARGADLFNRGLHWEAHEAWEQLWLELSDEPRVFVQGLIQVAAAFHHYSRENLLGTRKLLQAGLLKLDSFPETHGGLEIEPLRCEVREWVAVLTSGQVPGGMNPPQIARSHAARSSAPVKSRDD